MSKGTIAMIKIKQIVTGILKENCYIIYQDDKALIIDPGDDFF